MKKLVVLAAAVVALSLVGTAAAAPLVWKTPNQVSKKLMRQGIKFGSDGGVRYVIAAFCEGREPVQRAWNGQAIYAYFACAYQVANGAVWQCNRVVSRVR